MSKSNEFDWETARSVAKAVAGKVARSYPGIDADDIEQAILERVAEQQPLFKRMQYPPNALGNIFRQYGTRYANDERVAAYTFNDQYHYTNKEVRALLGKALFDPETFYASIEEDSDLVSRFDEIMARVVDLQAAFNDASDADKAIIRRKFLDGATLTPAEAKASQRAVDRLSLAINKGRSVRRAVHDGPGSRKAMSNLTAQNVTRSERDGGFH